MISGIWFVTDDNTDLRPRISSPVSLLPIHAILYTCTDTLYASRVHACTRTCVYARSCTYERVQARQGYRCKYTLPQVGLFLPFRSAYMRILSFLSFNYSSRRFTYFSLPLLSDTLEYSLHDGAKWRALTILAKGRRCVRVWRRTKSRLQQFFGLLPFPLPNYVHFFRGEKESLDESLRFLPSFLPEDWIRLLAGSRRTVRYGYRAAI